MARSMISTSDADLLGAEVEANGDSGLNEELLLELEDEAEDNLVLEAIIERGRCGRRP